MPSYICESFTQKGSVKVTEDFTKKITDYIQQQGLVEFGHGMANPRMYFCPTASVFFEYVSPNPISKKGGLTIDTIISRDSDFTEKLLATFSELESAGNRREVSK